MRRTSRLSPQGGGIGTNGESLMSRSQTHLQPGPHHAERLDEYVGSTPSRYAVAYVDGRMIVPGESRRPMPALPPTKVRFLGGKKGV